MQLFLENKLTELKNAKDYECWYLVKHSAAFDSLCYLVSFLKAFQSDHGEESLEDYVVEKVRALRDIKPEIEISENYRALRVAAFFGLIIMPSVQYEEAVITETFEEIDKRCGGAFEETERYSDIIQRQIEKMFISSPVDKACDGVREKYRLYPVMLLYKVLLELGRSTGKYAVTMNEYRYLVATTKVFEDFLDTLVLIKALRQDSSANARFEEYRKKFDNRMIQALKQLPTLTIDRNEISIKEAFVKETAHKVYIFEENPKIFATEHYLDFLGSTKSLFEIEAFEKERLERLWEEKRIAGGENILLYGVPGSGKSWTIANEYCSDESRIARIVFHPDYTYSDFIGQILPKVSDASVRYVFSPGPLTVLMKKAYENPEQEFFLIIEEINRGNAPAVFGDVFQLLDRKTEVKSSGDDGFQAGTSVYGITNEDIAGVVYGDVSHPVRFPSNMTIIGTMNTSDQNVFTLDTAFQRRWEMRLVENSFKNADRKFAAQPILDTSVTWEVFCTEMNRMILENNVRITSSEDKRLGIHFVQMRDLVYDAAAENVTLSEMEIIKARRNNSRFAEKVLKYLWDDAFKFSRENIFDVEQYHSLEAVICKFNGSLKNERFSVFKQEIADALVDPDRNC